MSGPSASYATIPSPSSSDEVDSLPSSDAGSSTSSDEEYSDAELQWRESLQQLELMATLVIFPYFGKYFGRKAAYWSWAKFMEWKYPVSVEITNPGLFRAAGAVGAAASL